MHENKKILWLASWYPNRIDPYSGDFIQRHARAVSLLRPVHVIFVVKDPNCRNKNGVSVEHNNVANLWETIAYYRPFKTGFLPVDRLLSLLKYRKLSRQLVSQFIAEEGKPLLTHVHIVIWGGDTALWLKKKKRIPYIITENWTGYYEADRDGIRQKGTVFLAIIKKILRNTVFFFQLAIISAKKCSNSLSVFLLKVIPNVVDTTLFKCVAVKRSAFNFIHVSTMSYQKNAEGILRCFADLLRLYPDISLVMVGPAPDKLKLLSTQLNIEPAVFWTGEIVYAEVARIMQEASCLLLFSRYENLPCVVLEALCCGLTVIASAVGGLPEIIDDTNGILVQSENEDELLKGMFKMIQKADDYNRADISAAAISKYNYLHVGKEITDVYDEILK